MGLAIIDPLFAINAILTALIEKAKRLVYLNSGIHRGADMSLQDCEVETALLARTGVGGAKGFRVRPGLEGSRTVPGGM